MSRLYKNKYRIESIRLKGWDYSTAACYFITICIKNHYCWFADVKNAIIELSDAGKIAHTIWQAIPEYFINVKSGPFVIMPNHIHGILNLIDNVETRLNRVSAAGNADGVSINDSNHIKSGGVTGKHNPMLNNSISRIIRWYKGRCSYEIRKSGYKNFNWQGLFYDHIIRDEQDYNRIFEYINNNPAKWQEDKYYTS